LHADDADSADKRRFYKANGRSRYWVKVAIIDTFSEFQAEVVYPMGKGDRRPETGDRNGKEKREREKAFYFLQNI